MPWLNISVKPHHAKWLVATGLVLVFAAALAAYFFRGPGHASALWRIVHTQCVPHVQSGGDPRPCALVDIYGGEQNGFAVLKDLVGVAQHLLIPTRRISGIESADVLADGTPNYFEKAFQARHFVEERVGRTLPRDAIGLAINSAKARSQDQLHIHIDCMRADIREQLASRARDLPEGWSPDVMDLLGAPYRVFKSSQPNAGLVNPFRIVADGVTGARDHMGDMTIVMVGLTASGGPEGFLVLAGQHDPAKNIRGHGEDVLDHSCVVAK